MEFITGLQINVRLKADFNWTLEEARKKRQRTGRDATVYASAYYQARSWSRPRRIICRVLVTANGEDMRFIVTSFTQAEAKYLYETVYCGRGAMELMIKDHKNGLRSDRTSCHNWWPNQLRLMISSFSYVLFDHIRRTALRNTRLAHATSATIRNKLIRIGAVIVRNTRRIRFHLSAAYPRQELFALVAARLQ